MCITPSEKGIANPEKNDLENNSGGVDSACPQTENGMPNPGPRY
jgi:hypothetical protein